MIASELRELSGDELLERERELRASIFKLRFRNTQGNEQGVSKIRSLKRDVARVKTIFREKTLES